MPTKRTDHDSTDESEPETTDGAGTAEATAESRPDQGAGDLPSQLEEANSRLLRVAADFENFKKRARQEQADTMRYAAATLAERLLPVLDDAQRTLQHVPEGVDETWLKGLEMTFRKLDEVLASVGVERVDALGQRFDPNLHEAIGSEESREQPEDTVVSELRPGYRIHDRVLRPALVKVARRPA
jgi:molecular chaperone GrpE